MQVIINGGEPLKDCPNDPKEAKKWMDQANESREEFNQPHWSWDCGYKLDFDGPVISISSRFYPPKSHYGESWDGSMSLIFGDQTLATYDIEASTIEELKQKVEHQEALIKEKLVKLLYGQF